MGIRFNGAGDELVRTTNLPSHTNVTACGWARRTTNSTSDYQGIWLIRNTAYGNAIGIYTRNSPANLDIWAFDSGPVTLAAAPALGTWFFWAVTCSGNAAGNFIGYYRTLGQATLTSASGDPATFSNDAMNIGGATGVEAFDGDVFGVKIWDAVLTQAEILAESAQVRPRRLQNLHSFSLLHDSTTSGVRDLTGNAYNWTISGTPVDAENPPVRLMRRRAAQFRRAAQTIVNKIRQYANGYFQSAQFVEVSGPHAMRMYANAQVQIEEMQESVGGSLLGEGIKFFWHGSNTTLDAIHDRSTGDTSATATGSPTIIYNGMMVGQRDSFGGILIDAGTEFYSFDPTGIVSTSVGCMGFLFRPKTWTALQSLVTVRGSNSADTIRFLMNGTDEINFQIGRNGGSTSDLITTAANLVVNKIYFIVGRWDEPNNKRSIEVYDLLGTLLHQTQDLSTNYDQPVAFDDATGFRIGTTGVDSTAYHLQNIMVSSNYDEPLQNNIMIESFTEYGILKEFGTTTIGGTTSDVEARTAIIPLTMPEDGYIRSVVMHLRDPGNAHEVRGVIYNNSNQVLAASDDTPGSIPMRVDAALGEWYVATLSNSLFVASGTVLKVGGRFSGGGDVCADFYNTGASGSSQTDNSAVTYPALHNPLSTADSTAARSYFFTYTPSAVKKNKLTANGVYICPQFIEQA